MRFLRGKDARWCPARFHFALPRLLALFRSSRDEPVSEGAIAMAVDRDQTAWEMYAVCCWMFGTVAVYCADFIARYLPWWIAAPAAVPAAAVALEMPFFLGGAILVLRDRLVSRGSENHIRFNSFLTVLIVTVASSYFLLDGSVPARIAGALFVALLVAN
ncbi:MAG TPA: hypothetical protein VFL80_12660, partial [Thermoanaerobaculia bacterium]|nr:hypothetical protein [Thermoanaerobaculia bacterium]